MVVEVLPGLFNFNSITKKFKRIFKTIALLSLYFTLKTNIVYAKDYIVLKTYMKNHYAKFSKNLQITHKIKQLNTKSCFIFVLLLTGIRIKAKRWSGSLTRFA